MINNNFSRLWLFIIFCFALVGCKEKEINFTAPNEIVAQYFEALFNEQDFSKVLHLSSEGNKELVERYGSCQSVARYLYNLNFEHAEVYAERPSGLGYVNSSDSLRINVAVTGYSQGKKIDEAFEIVVLYEQGSWKVDRMLPRQY